MKLYPLVRSYKVSPGVGRRRKVMALSPRVPSKVHRVSGPSTRRACIGISDPMSMDEVHQPRRSGSRSIERSSPSRFGQSWSLPGRGVCVVSRSFRGSPDRFSQSALTGSGSVDRISHSGNCVRSRPVGRTDLTGKSDPGIGVRIGYEPTASVPALIRQAHEGKRRMRPILTRTHTPERFANHLSFCGAVCGIVLLS